MAITVERAAPYVVAADGHTVDVHSDSTRVIDILADNGIALGALDYTRPAAAATVAPGDTIEVVRVTERIDTEEVPVPFETVFEGAADLEIDTLLEASPGSGGILQRRTRVRLENGVEVSQRAGRREVCSSRRSIASFATARISSCAPSTRRKARSNTGAR
jgi:uncharacterized protein YabE (DUF348 family)